MAEADEEPQTGAGGQTSAGQAGGAAAGGDPTGAAASGISPSESVTALHRRIAELEQQLDETALLKERVAMLEERKLGASLEGIQEQLGAVKGRMGAIESRRDAWIRTLLLTLAAPLAAGVFGQVTKQRDVQLKKFEQNLDLVDRALEFEKGPAYRKATLEYILDVNSEEEPIAVWANEQLELQVKPQFNDVKTVADTKVQEVKALEEELERSAAELEQIEQDLEQAATSPPTGSGDYEKIAKDAAKRQHVADKAQKLQQRIETETEAANALLNQAGQAPIVTPPPVEDMPLEAEADEVAVEPLIYIQVASFNSERLVDAQDHLDLLAAYQTLLLFREPFYVVMVGPFADVEAAGELIERAKNDPRSEFHQGAKIRDLNKFCGVQVQTAEALVCTPN